MSGEAQDRGAGFSSGTLAFGVSMPYAPGMTNNEDAAGAPLHPNTDHDEAYNRAHWTGEAWLGIESMRAPKHGAPREVRSGTFAATGRKASTRGKGTYR